MFVFKINEASQAIAQPAARIAADLQLKLETECRRINPNSNPVAPPRIIMAIVQIESIALFS